MIRFVFLSLLLASVVIGLDLKIRDNSGNESMMDSASKGSHNVEETFADETRFYSEKEEDDNEDSRSKIYELKRESRVKASVIKSYPTDCADLKRAGVNESGVYYIYPFSCSCLKPVKVYCDMETDGGGWTYLLWRKNQGAIGQLNFNQTWEAYKSGFGEADKEHWIGNHIIYQMTRTRNYILRADMTHTNGRSDSLIYSSFSVGAEPTKYRVSFGSYMSESTLGTNCFSRVNGQSFSTYDRDNSASNCTANGAFWYNSCPSYGVRIAPTSYYNDYMNITCYYNKKYKVTDFSMKIRPVPCEDTQKLIHIGGCAKQCHITIAEPMRQ